MKPKPRILAVDDDKLNLSLMEMFLMTQGYEVLLAPDGKTALSMAKESSPGVILLDAMMPGMDGFEVARRLRADETTQIIPIVMVTALDAVKDRVNALEAGADDFLSKPVDRTELMARVRSLLKVKAYHESMRNYQQHLEVEVARKTKELQQTALETIHRLTRAAEYRDDDTGLHILRMSHYAATIAQQMGQDRDEVESLLYAAPMHDVGKIGIPDGILLKKGKLAPEEWEIMKTHATLGARILEGSHSEIIQLAELIALTHHEKWDGNGYPNGLKGEEIPLVGRIAAVADVFDALTSKRPYKEAFPVEKAKSILHADRGSHFDPAVVDAFFEAETEFIAIKEKFGGLFTPADKLAKDRFFALSGSSENVNLSSPASNSKQAIKQSSNQVPKVSRTIGANMTL
jgi:putative two-component system response regulator